MHHEDRAGVDAFLAGIDGLAGSNLPIVVVLCTNRLNALDPAVRRRAAATFEFGRPNSDQRRQVLGDALADFNIDDATIDKLVDITGPDSHGQGSPGYTYSDLTQRLIPTTILEAFPEVADHRRPGPDGGTEPRPDAGVHRPAARRRPTPPDGHTRRGFVSGPLARPSATAVRIAGDRYQWLHVWRACLQVLRDQAAPGASANPAVSVGVEVDGVGNVDDVVLYRQHPPHTYSQVKWTANGETPVGTDYLTADDTPTPAPACSPSSPGHTRHSPPTATRPISSSRPTATSTRTASSSTGIDPRTQLLLPNAALQGPASRRGRERAAWAASANVTETELLELLAVLRFETGYGLNVLLDNVSNLMTATGLRDDTTARPARDRMGRDNR